MNEQDETYQENISALLDGELSELEARALRACVETSPEPRAVFEAFSAVENALPGAFPEAPAGLHEHILSGVRRAASQNAPQSRQQEANTPRHTKRRASPRRLRAAVIAAACLVAVITGAALSGRFLRMGRTGAGASADTTTMSFPGDGMRVADAGGAASGQEDGVAVDTAGVEEETATDPQEAAADISAVEDAAKRLEGLTSFTVSVDGEAYEGAYAVAAVDEFFDSEPTDKVLNLSVAFPYGGDYNVQLWYRDGKAVCSLNEDGVEVRSLEEILAYFQG